MTRPAQTSNGFGLAQRLTRPRERSRIVCMLAFAATIGAGLASRRFIHGLPPLLSKYPGDALWALMVFFGLGALFRTAPTWRVAAGALGFSYFIEVLKLWQAPWLVSLRHTTLGHLVFGHVFSWQNMVAYAVGVALGCVIETLTRRDLDVAS